MLYAYNRKRLKLHNDCEAVSSDLRSEVTKAIDCDFAGKLMTLFMIKKNLAEKKPRVLHSYTELTVNALLY